MNQRWKFRAQSEKLLPAALKGIKLLLRSICYSNNNTEGYFASGRFVPEDVLVRRPFGPWGRFIPLDVLSLVRLLSERFFSEDVLSLGCFVPLDFCPKDILSLDV
jgi:hypothetical protein